MASRNKYTENKTSEQNTPTGNQLLLDIMKSEFPSDSYYSRDTLGPAESPVLSDGSLPFQNAINTSILEEFDRTENGTVSVLPRYTHEMEGAESGERMEGRMHAGAVSGSETIHDRYAKYDLKTSYPTVDEDELDEIIDEEWDYFEDPDDEPPIEIVEKGESGLFLANMSFNLRDMHDLYIQEGPELIMELGDDEQDKITNIFCVFYTVNGVAYPIPNYKTLEVMLVDNGFTYNSVKVATDQQKLLFDLDMSGEPDEYGDSDGAVDEFRRRLGYGAVIDRSSEWTPEIRFRADYEVKAPFKRDPGDYIKPRSIRGKNESETTLGPRIDLYQQEDVEDIYFDQAFMGQTTREKLREQFEGKMIILDWPTDEEGNYDGGQVTRGTSVTYDDAVLGLRMMINGHWKQVRSGFVMRLYAETNPQFLDSKGKMAVTNYLEGQGRYGPRGLINLLVQAGAVTVINDAGDTSTPDDDGNSDPLWSLFSHIVDADGSDQFKDPQSAAEAGVRTDGVRGLDRTEYVEYLDNYTNGGKPFNVAHLERYEPKGSIAYYDQDQYRSLVAEAIVQGQIDEIKSDILEIFPRVASSVQETRGLFNTLPDNYNKYVTDMLGARSPMYRVMRSDEPWKYVKKKRKKIKKKDDRYNIFKLYSKNWRMKWNLNEREENKIVSNGGKHWMKTISRDKFPDKLEKIAGINAGVAFAINPLAGLGALTTYGLTKAVNRLVGTVPHGRTDKLPPWRFMDDDTYLKSCIAEQWMKPVEEMYTRSVEIDDNWTNIVDFIDDAEGTVGEFDKKFQKADNVEDCLNLLNDLDEIEAKTGAPEMINLIDSANGIRVEVDDYLKSSLMNQYKAIEYMRERVHNGQGRRKKFGISWPKSVQRIYHKYCYDQTVNFGRYNPKK